METKVTPGKCRCMSKTVDPMEEKMLEILKYPKNKTQNIMQKTCFFVSLAGTFRVLDPHKRKYSKLKMQQALYNIQYGGVLCSQNPLQLCILLQSRMDLITHMRGFLTHSY